MLDTVKKKILKKNNIIDTGDNESINLNDIIDFLKDIIDGKIILIKKKNIMKNLKILKKN